MPWIWLALGIARLGIGGGIRPGLRTISTLAAAAIAVGATWGYGWPLVAVNVVGLLVLITLPHGPMLTLPISQRSDGKIDYEYKLVSWIGNSELRWWAYALLRYPGVAAIWAAARYAVHAEHWWAPLASVVIPLSYRLLWPSRRTLPQFNRPGDQVENWVELAGWTALGAALAVQGP